ncbi:MAG: hypothetical protein N2578_05665 [Bdellovibrionaceae bacterium]|nr:hypothetical protein [Pseudobdellovibrionaceae bacterium]
MKPLISSLLLWTPIAFGQVTVDRIRVPNIEFHLVVCHIEKPERDRRPFLLCRDKTWAPRVLVDIDRRLLTYMSSNLAVKKTIEMDPQLSEQVVSTLKGIRRCGRAHVVVDNDSVYDNDRPLRMHITSQCRVPHKVDY